MQHGWLTTVRVDGSPRTSRVWFVELDSIVWIATSESAWKVADIRRDPRVSFAIEGEHGALVATATVESTQSWPAVLSKFRRAYDGWDAADPGPNGPRVLLRLA